MISQNTRRAPETALKSPLLLMSRQSEALESLQVSCTKENFIWSVINNRLAAESILSKFENTFRHICDLQCLSFRAFSAQGPMHLTSYADVMIHRNRSQCFRFHNESNISCRLKRSELSSLVVDLSRFSIETLCSSWIYFDCTVLFDSESTEDGAEKNGTKIEKPCRWKLIRNEKTSPNKHSRKEALLVLKWVAWFACPEIKAWKVLRKCGRGVIIMVFLLCLWLASQS